MAVPGVASTSTVDPTPMTDPPAAAPGFTVVVAEGASLEAAIGCLAVQRPDLVPAIDATIDAQPSGYTPDGGQTVRNDLAAILALGCQPVEIEMAPVATSGPEALGGYLKLEGQMTITSFLCRPTCRPVSSLTHYAVWDQGYRTVRITSKTATTVNSAGWTYKSVRGVCTRGATACGAVAMHTGSGYSTVTPSQTPSSSSFRWTVTFSARYNGVPSSPFSGNTPWIKCDAAVSMCKWQ